MKTADEIIAEIAEVLAESDGEFIAKIANQVLAKTVTYDGDSLFSQDNIISPEQATRIRIFVEGFHWSIDAADEEGNHTETVWDHYNRKRMYYRMDAIKAVKAFAIEIGRIDLLNSVYAQLLDDGAGYEKLSDEQVFGIPRKIEVKRNSED